MILKTKNFIITTIAAAAALSIPVPSWTAENCSTAAGQSSSYCAAAKSAREAEKSNKALTVVYSGVAAVCGYACVVGVPGPSQMACQGSNIAAGVTDAVMTQNYMGALMTVGMSAGQMMMRGDGNIIEGFKKMGGRSATNTATSAGATSVDDAALASVDAPGADRAAEAASSNQASAGTEAATQEKDHSACLTAALAGIQAFSRNASANAAGETAQAAETASNQVTQNTAPNFSPTQGSSGGLSPNDPVAGARTGVAAQNTAKPTEADPCNSRDFQGTIQCAMAADPSVGQWAGDPRFQKALTDLTGLSPDQFKNKVENSGPVAAISDGIGAGMGVDVKGQIAAVLGGIDQSVASSAYAGGGRPRGGGSGDPDFNSMMGDLMAQFGPKKDQNTAAGVNEARFGNGRSPASIAEDRSISLFERVSARYHAVSRSSRLY